MVVEGTQDGHGLDAAATGSWWGPPDGLLALLAA